MRRSFLTLGLSVAASALALLGHARDARACGGCFQPPTQVASDITDERMLLSVSTQQTTLYDQIRYAGSPSSFAWVLPIHGTVDVGLSADVLFDSVDALTATTIQQPPSSCPGIPSSCYANGGGAAFGAAASDAGTAPGDVTVTKQQNVGPYETVQLHSTDPTALETWLQQNGFEIPANVQPVLDEYVKEGFDFLAMKLIPGAGVNAMRPVRVTAPGASLSLPLRMAAIGTGATVGITIWVVADGRYEPQNFPFFHVENKDLVWDWKTSSSNYTTLRTAAAATFNGRGWELESSIAVQPAQVSNVIRSGGRVYGPYGGGYPGASTADAGDDYLAVPGDDSGTNPPQTASQVREADIAALFAGMNANVVRVTRMRSDIAHAAMTTDFVLQASADQSELPNLRQVTQSINEQCPIYQGCEQVGTGSPEQAQAAQNAGGGESFACTTSARAWSANDVGGALLGAGALAMVGVARRRRRRR